jgi:PKD repeat protein
MTKTWLIVGVFLLLLFPIGAMAQEADPVQVIATTACDVASFEVQAPSLPVPADLDWDFGDGETLSETAIQVFPHTTSHVYPYSGDFSWTLDVVDSDGAPFQVMGVVSIGPSVSLGSDPFPPLLDLEAGEAVVSFTATVEGGSAPYVFEWDLDGDGVFESSGAENTASFSYTSPGKYQATVRVIDECGLSVTDTLPVVVIDPEADVCHPTAQKISDAVNTLFPSQAMTLYTCEDIFDFFTGGLTGEQLGFGRMWHAYKLSQTIEELTWEEILDWHLEQNGWGRLVQLDRFADELSEVGVGELVEKVLTGENSVNEIRTAARLVSNYEVDFEEALERAASGDSFGQIKQFYRTAGDLDLDDETLDEYVAMGLSLSEINHAAKVADQTGGDWTEIALAHASGLSWGELKQAYKLAGEDGNAPEIIQTGVKEFQQQQREEERAERSQEKDQRTAARLAEQFGVVEGEVWALFQGPCGMDWSCVQKELRNQERYEGEHEEDDKTARTAAQIANKYGVSVEEVMQQYEGACGMDWSCVRTHFREQAKEGRGKDK